MSEERRSLGGQFGTITIARGEEVEEKSSRFVALVAFPVRSRGQAEAALSLLRAHPALAGNVRINPIQSCAVERWVNDSR